MIFLMYGEKLEQDTDTKYFGVVFDETLSRRPHIHIYYTSNKINKGIGI